MWAWVGACQRRRDHTPVLLLLLPLLLVLQVGVGVALAKGWVQHKGAHGECRLLLWWQHKLRLAPTMQV